jgi:WD40 repeat protein
VTWFNNYVNTGLGQTVGTTAFSLLDSGTKIFFKLQLFILLSLLLTNCEPYRSDAPILAIRPVPTAEETIGVMAPIIATYVPPTPTPLPLAITSSTISEMNLLRRFGTGSIQEAHWSEDGNQLIVITDYGVYTYEAETLDLEEIFILESEYVLADFCPSGMYAVVLDVEGASYLRDIRNGLNLNELRNDWTVLNWSNDSSRLVIGYGDGTVHVVDVQTGDLIWEFTLSRFAIEEVTFSLGGGIVLAKDDEGWFVFWEMDEGSEVLRDKIIQARDMQIAPDESAFAFITGLGTLKVWTFPDEWIQWEITAEVYGPKVDRFLIHPDGQTVLLNYQTGTRNEVRDFTTGEKIGITSYLEEFIGGINPTKELKFRFRGRKKIEVLETAKNSVVAFTTLTDYGECLAFSSSQNVFATNYGLWDVWSGEPIIEIDGDCPIRVSQDGVNLGIRLSYRSIAFYDTASLEKLGVHECIRTYPYSPDIFSFYDISVGGTMFACYPGGERVYVYDVATRERIFEFRTINYDTALQFSVDGKYLGALSHGFLRVWDLETGYRIRDPVRVEEPVSWWASDDLMTWILHLREGRDAIVTWDPNQAVEQSRVWLESEGSLTSKISPGAEFLALVKPEAIELWDIATGQLVFLKEWPRGIPSDVRLAFSPDRHWLAMYVPGGPIWIWGIPV